MNILSFNLRIDVPVDGTNAWNYRKEDVINFLVKRDADLIGFQEVGPHMYVYLKHNLTSYDSFYVGRDQYGEGTPIFLKKNKYKLLEANTIWLTQTPHKESIITGSNFTRIASYVVFENQRHEVIAFFNTHLDYSGDETTYKQSVHLQNYIDAIKEKYDAKIIICGDFNSFPDSKTISYFSDKYQTTFNLNDENQLTFHGYSDNKKGMPIDYFFVDNRLTINKFEIIYNKNNKYLSDHYPISIKL